MSATPTTIFAALMSALERPDAQSSPATALAMCTLLGTALSRVPNGVLRSKFVGSVQLLGRLVEQHRQQAAAAKAGLMCLGQVLAAVEPGAWPAAAPGFQLLLSFLTDARPKVRKRAQSSVSEVLAALQGSPASLAAASEAIVAVCKAVLPGPSAAARAAAAASNKQRAAAEAAIAAAVSDVLHLLAALKTCAPLMAGAGSGLGGASGAAGGDQLSAMARLLESGLGRLSELASEAAGKLLPKVVHLLVPLLAAEQDGVRYNTSGALQSLLESCLSPSLVAALQQQGGSSSSRGGMSPLTSLVAAVASGLGARYQEAWGLALPVAGVLCENLAAGGAAAAAAPVVAALGQICAGLADEAEQNDAAMDVEGEGAGKASSSSYAHAAEAAMGVAIRSLGPQVVLEVLPLQIHEGLAGTAEARTWLLPALRKHVRGSQLGFWASHLGPLAKQMGAAAAAASQAGRKSTAVACHALELQLWGCLQAFAAWPTDAAEAYEGMAPDLAAVFHTREDLRGNVATVLVRLCKQARAVALAAAQGSVEASPKTLAAIQALGLVSGAAAAIPGAGKGEDEADEAAEDGEQQQQQQEGSEDEDDEEEYGQQQQQQGSRAAGIAGRRRRSILSVDADVGPDAASAAPAAFTAEVALGQLLALRASSLKWLRLMCKVFIELPAESRSHVGEALAATASVADPQELAGLFRLALQKYGKIARDAAAEVPPPDPILDGGGSPEERQASFLELALCLAGGLPDAALDPLFAACRQHVLGGSSLLQKRCYRVLDYLAAARPQWLQAHLGQLLELLLLGSAAALSPAKRYRLRCLQPLILLLDTTPCPALPGLVDAATGAELVPGGAALAAAAAAVPGRSERQAAEQRRVALAQLLVGELVLATKEVNKKTRTAAYQLIVDIAHELDEARPLSLNPGDSLSLNPADSDADDASSDDMDYGDDAQKQKRGGRGSKPASGGLLDFVNAVMGGLVGSSPHMQSAAVLALARLSFEFAGQLEGVVGRLLPAVLLLLRSQSREVIKAVLGFIKVGAEHKGLGLGVCRQGAGGWLASVVCRQSREVIKAVLGFIKVCATRMPVDLLMIWLPQILEGMLLWADDSKNKFRLKIRVIVERLVRRCGYEAVASACPPGDAKLLSHIRKQASRKERRKAQGSEGGSQADAAEFDHRSQRSAGSAARSVAGRTARASEWGHTAIFSEDGDAATQAAGHAAGYAARGGPAGSAAARSRFGDRPDGRRGGSGVRLAGDGAADDPLDLLEAATARQLVRSAAGNAAGGRGAGGAAAAAAAEFPRGDDGRMLIKEEKDEFGHISARRAGKRKRGNAEEQFGGFGDEDDSDMEDMKGFAGLAAAVKSVANAKSVKFAPSIAASLGNRSTASKKSAGGRSEGGRSSGGKGSQHSGERFRAKGSASGDVKGKGGGIDPYAYWQFDRKMLNRRRGKQAEASKGLGGVVAGAQAGALKGAKAKRAANAKRARR
ncbi:hypothetical protein OEZ86_003236 [Tetradesmus obliquus]|nr:hypothetical protein OEZ86_003236 [Tetradesmus obliquus]